MERIQPINAVYIPYKKRQLRDISIHKSMLEIVYFYPPKHATQPKIEKEIWQVQKGELQLVRTIEGTYTPPQQIPEQFEF